MSGKTTIVTEGLALVDLGVRVDRAIDGDTGRDRAARGDSTQKLLGFDPSSGVNLCVVVRSTR